MKLLRTLCVLFCILSPAWGQFFGGGGGGKGDKVTFAVCTGAPCSAGTDIANRYIVTSAGKLKKCYITAKTAPEGSPLILDVKRNGTTVFVPGNLLSLPAAQTVPASISTFAVTSLAEGDVVTVDIVQTGSTTPAQDVTAVCVWK